MNDEARFEALRARLAELMGRSPALARQLGGLDLSELRRPEDLARIPVLRKSALAARQSAEPPFGSLAAAPTGAFPRLFASPGGIYEPESAGRDPWGTAKAFDAVGVVAGMGDGVNIAARLEGVAKPGAICLSEDAYRQVSGGRLDMAVADLGPTQLKNIERPIRVYSLQVGVPAVAKPATPAGPIAPKKRSSLAPLAAGIAALLIILTGGAWWLLGRPTVVAPKSPASVASSVTTAADARHLSLVVLPFTNLSNDPSQDHFGDGVTENLTTDRSRLSGAFAIARNTAFTFKGKNVDAREIGKELGIRYVLEGSVQRDAGRMRVNVQLIDAETGNHLWADRFDKPLSDLFEMQDEIVGRLANQLGTALTAAEARRAQQAPQADSMDLYFQGLASFNKGIGLENMDHARGFFERALALDPGNVDALLGVGRADFIVGAAHLSDQTPAHLAAAEVTIAKVLSFRPNEALAHEILGGIMTQTKRSDQAIAEFERALALDSNRAAAHASIGNAKMFIGRAGETEADINEALRLSPRDSFASVWLLMAGGAKLTLGADAEAGRQPACRRRLKRRIWHVRRKSARLVFDPYDWL